MSLMSRGVREREIRCMFVSAKHERVEIKFLERNRRERREKSTGNGGLVLVCV